MSFDLGTQVALNGHVHGDGLADTGLESINDESRRWSMPITGGLTVRF